LKCVINRIRKIFHFIYKNSLSLFKIEINKQLKIKIKMTKTCLDCKKRPVFNFENETKAIYCTEHKKANMINVKSKTCLDCKKIPVFNFENETKAEKIRMYEISQSYPEFPACIWIRYNPDSFKDENKKPVKIANTKRHDILVKWVKECLKNDKTEGVKVKYLFYDGYKETDGDFQMIERKDIIF